MVSDCIPRLSQPVHLIDVPDDDTIARVFGFVVDVCLRNVRIRNILKVLVVNPEFNHGNLNMSGQSSTIRCKDRCSRRSLSIAPMSSILAHSLSIMAMRLRMLTIICDSDISHTLGRRTMSMDKNINPSTIAKSASCTLGSATLNGCGTLLRLNSWLSCD